MYRQAQTSERSYNKLQAWVFDYPEKLNINIHLSLISTKALLAIRVLALLSLSFRYILQLENALASVFKTYEYLTQFGFHFTWIYFSTVCLDYLLNQLLSQKISKNLKDWVNLLFEIVWCSEFVITIIFWVILYDSSVQVTTQDALLNIGVHGFPLFCLLWDFIFNVYQFPKRHLILVIIIALLYMCVNISYSLLTTPVYPPLDWVTIKSYLYLIVCTAIFVGVFVMSRLIWTKCRKQKIIAAMKNDSESAHQLLSTHEQMLY